MSLLEFAAWVLAVWAAYLAQECADAEPLKSGVLLLLGLGASLCAIVLANGDTA